MKPNKTTFPNDREDYVQRMGLMWNRCSQDYRNLLPFEHADCGRIAAVYYNIMTKPESLALTVLKS